MHVSMFLGFVVRFQRFQGQYATYFPGNLLSGKIFNTNKTMEENGSVKRYKLHQISRAYWTHRRNILWKKTIEIFSFLSKSTIKVSFQFYPVFARNITWSRFTFSGPSNVLSVKIWQFRFLEKLTFSIVLKCWVLFVIILWVNLLILVQLQIEDISRKLRSGDLGIPPNPADRSDLHSPHSLMYLYSSATFVTEYSPIGWSAVVTSQARSNWRKHERNLALLRFHTSSCLQIMVNLFQLTWLMTVHFRQISFSVSVWFFINFPTF